MYVRLSDKYQRQCDEPSDQMI